MEQYSTSQKYNFHLYWDDDDSFVGSSVARDDYEPYESELFLAFTAANSVVIDVGANIGYYALLAAQKIMPQMGFVYAFEPEKRNYELLQKNIGANNIATVEPLKIAIAEDDGLKELFLSNHNKGDHQLYFSPDREIQTVECLRLDTFIRMKSLQPTIIKIDAQGYDYFVLKSGQSFIDNATNLVVFTEFWDHGNRHAGVDSREYFDYLNRTFKQVLYIDELKRDIYPVDFDFLGPVFAMHDNHGHGNFLCIR
ncbi:MAG: FkbM family methyltransferase [Candidatus Abawacabacteria bacterium]|nr:FkbM family methyltransferase [Candidatus Abawacabacteria bacterium]